MPMPPRRNDRRPLHQKGKKIWIYLAERGKEIRRHRLFCQEESFGRGPCCHFWGCGVGGSSWIQRDGRKKEAICTQQWMCNERSRQFRLPTSR